MKNILLLLLSFGLAPAAFAQTAPRPARELIDEGISLYDAGKYDEAVVRYQQVLASEPTNTIALSELALTYGSLNRHAEVVDICKKLINADPRVGQSVYATYGNSLDDLKKPKDAVRVYEQGLKYFPNSYSLHFNAGVTQARDGQVPASITSFQQAMTLNPNHASSHMSLGVMQLTENHRIPSLLALSRFLILEPRGNRAAQRLPLLDQAMTQGVTRTGEQSVTLNLSVKDVRSASRNRDKPDNFGPTEMMLSLVAARTIGKDSGTAVGRFAEQFTWLCKSLAEQDTPKTTGFTWNYYVPYFVELEKKGFVPAFAYLAHASQTDVPEVQQWLATHPNEVAVFQEWSKNYGWPKSLK